MVVAGRDIHADAHRVPWRPTHQHGAGSDTRVAHKLQQFELGVGSSREALTAVENLILWHEISGFRNQPHTSASRGGFMIQTQTLLAVHQRV